MAQAPPLGDPIEIHGLQKAFNQMAKDFNIQLPEQYCGIGTVKTNIGHLEAAAGIAGVIKILLAFCHGLLPSLQNFQLANPKIKLEGSPFYLVDKTREWQPRKDDKGKEIPWYAGVSSFGFGGANAHIALEEGPPYAVASQQTKPSYLLTISAKHPDSLKQRIDDLHFYLKEYPELCLEDIAYTLNLGRSHFNYRCALVVSSVGDLRDTLEQIQLRAGVGDPIVFLPPIDSISTAWRSQFLEFTKDYHIISLHYPGYGRSDFTPQPAIFNCISDILIEILDNLDIKTPIHLVDGPWGV